jgi:crotonobetainyl-CoA:carnitine CoA-transferase CaiB-like acyl-CoA transferase
LRRQAGARTTATAKVVDPVKALEGLRVIDFTQAMAAPFGTMNLADMGADVIKIEPPVTGEPTRELSSVTQNGHSATFMTMDRSKRVPRTGNARRCGDHQAAGETADVFVQNTVRRGLRLGLATTRPH